MVENDTSGKISMNSIRQVFGWACNISIFPAAFIGLLFGLLISPFAVFIGLVLPILLVLDYFVRIKSRKGEPIVKTYLLSAEIQRTARSGRGLSPPEFIVHMLERLIVFRSCTVVCYRGLYSIDRGYGWSKMANIISVAIESDGDHRRELLAEIREFLKGARKDIMMKHYPELIKELEERNLKSLLREMAIEINQPIWFFLLNTKIAHPDRPWYDIELYDNKNKLVFTHSFQTDEPIPELLAEEVFAREPDRKISLNPDDSIKDLIGKV